MDIAIGKEQSLALLFKSKLLLAAHSFMLVHMPRRTYYMVCQNNASKNAKPNTFHKDLYKTGIDLKRLNRLTAKTVKQPLQQ